MWGSAAVVQMVSAALLERKVAGSMPANQRVFTPVGPYNRGGGGGGAHIIGGGGSLAVRLPMLNKLHSKIIISGLEGFFRIELDGESPRSKFKLKHTKTDGQKSFG